jgi:hypothetical protein
MSVIEVDERESAPPRSHVSMGSIAACFVVVFVAVAAGFQLHAAGAFGPRLRATNDGWNGFMVAVDGTRSTAMVGGTSSREVGGTVTIRNDGSVEVRIVDAAMSGVGFRFERATAGGAAFGNLNHAGVHPVSVTAPLRLGPHHTVTLTLFLQITDCHAVAPTGAAVSLRVDSWRGVQTVVIPVPTVVHSYGGWTVVPASRQGAISSVRYLADVSCGIDMHN